MENNNMLSNPWDQEEKICEAIDSLVTYRSIIADPKEWGVKDEIELAELTLTSAIQEQYIRAEFMNGVDWSPNILDINLN
jgi:hypothetical protein